MVKRMILLAAAILALIPLSIEASAANRDPSPHSEVQIISESPQSDSFWIALELTADEGWHTYWKNPGDTGLPTKITWEANSSLTVGEIQWPIPERIENPPLVSYGYHGKVVLPMRVTLPKNYRAGSPLSLRGKASWLICREVCLPASETIEWRWPNAINETPEEQRTKITDALQLVPKNLSHDPKMSLSAVTDGVYFEASVSLESPRVAAAREFEFFPLEAKIFDHAVPLQSEKGARRFRWVRKLKDPYSRNTLPGVVALSGPGNQRSFWQGEAIVRQGTIEPILAELPSEKGGLPWMFIFAFVGGLLLNLMPCVFPVLSIKVMSLIEKSKSTSAQAKRLSWYYAFGVLATFWALSLALVTLKKTGAQLGWGFQLQSPAFVATLCGLFFLLGLNLLGVFEWGETLMGLGAKESSKADERSPLLGSFLTGVLAVIVATPCTAPFMGTAIGFAFSQSAWAVWVVFTGLGFGLAFPFLVLAHQPKLLKLLPRPGAWMETLKQALAFPLLGTIIWLLWTVTQQAGGAGLVAVLSGLWLIGIGAWAWHRFAGKALARGGTLAIAIAFLILVLGVSTTPPPGAPLQGQLSWQPYSAETLHVALSAKKAVFIDFTAAWCLTCQVNDRIVFSRQEVIEAFHSRDVLLLKADWTRQDPEITRALDSMGRSGVPVYALYLPGASSPRLLPEVLAPSIVIQALEGLPIRSLAK